MIWMMMPVATESLVLDADIVAVVGLPSPFLLLTLLQPTFMAEGSEGFSQCADILASCLSLKLASKSTGNMLFLVTILNVFVVLSLISAHTLSVELQPFAVEPSDPSGSSG
jgi:hypothetical protein